ncbi:MAG: hypothetical protein JWN95_32 [Frankiales bacterium]|nr:hypothetical protein [Frankiales bacterium]
MTAATRPNEPDPDRPGRTVRVSQPRWALATTYTVGVGVASVLAMTGLLLSRLDIALLALPLIAASAWTWDRRPDRTQPSTVTVDLSGRPGQAELEFTLGLSVPDGVEGISLRVTKLGGEVQELLVSPHTMRGLTSRVPLLHSGPQEVVRVEYRLLAADASVVSISDGPLNVDRVVTPAYTAIASLPLPHRLQGLTGTHDSARPGDGGDFRDIHPFTAGDRLRRIDWKATARRGRFAGDLYVRRTAATADATVLIVIDSRDDVGEQVSEWSSNSATMKGTGSLDLAREAASSIAAGYIKVGDRVGFQDLASENRMIAHGGGSQHLWRLLRAIELTRPSGTRTHRQRPPVVVSGALIYVLSSFLDEEAGRMAALWRGNGHRVIAVDVLPTALFGRTTRYDRLAHRILMMERRDRVRSLEAQGVEIVRWQDDGESAPREARLRLLSRPVRGRR